jgi:Uncharacterised nucleotidyltransferase
MKRTLRHAILRQLNVTEDKPSPPILRTSFGKREWDEALEWLDLSGLAVYFLQRIRSSGASYTLPDFVRTELERRGADNGLRTQEILREFQVFIEAFEQARVKYAVLKGISLLPDYCPDLEYRAQYDHDVLVDADTFDTACRALEAAGYYPKDGADEESVAVYRPVQPEIRFSRNSEALYSARLGRSIEVHRTLWEGNEDRIRLRLPEDFLDRRQLRYSEGIRFAALCEEDCLLFQVLHAFKHILRNWCRLSIFLEVAHFLNRRATDSNFWRNYASRIENIRWAPQATLIVFTLAEQLFGAPIPAQLRSTLRTPLFPALNLWIERYGKYSALSNFHDDKSSLFLHREFVESASEWAAIRRKRLFPIRRPHRPPAVVFQRGFSNLGRVWMEKAHAFGRLRFHGLSGLRYALEYPRWVVLRRMRLAHSGYL